MAGGIKIPISVDASDSARAIKNDLIDPLEDFEKVAKKVDDVKVDGLEDSMKDAQRETKDAADELDKLRDRIQDVDKANRGSRGGADLGDSYRKGSHEASESVSTFKDEAKANLSEVSSSFTGDIQSITDLVQGTLGGVVADLGPIGLVAGAAAAAGVGLIGAAITGAQEDAEAFQQRVSDLTNDLIETGRRGSASLSYISDELQEMASATDDGTTSLKELRQAADRSGNSYKDLAQAAAGHTDEIDKQIKAAVKQKNEWQQTGQGILEADDALGSSANNRSKALDEYISYLRSAKKASKEAADQQKNFADAGGPALIAAAEATQNYADGVQDAYSEAGSAIDDYVKDGNFNLKAYTTNAEKQFQAIADYQSNMVTLSKTLSDEALQYVQSLGPDAAPAIDAFVKAPLDQQQQTADVWAKLGSTSATNFNSRLQNDLGAKPATKNVTVIPDMAQFNSAMAEATRQREVHIKAYTDAPRGVQPMGAP